MPPSTSAMETPLPSTDSLKSLNVEESRAKRLERQQARLRDRGGIFRPTNRNNDLFDILCKANHRQSPTRVRGRSRSRSVSPRKKSAVPSVSEKHTAQTQPTPNKRTTRPDTTTIVELPEENTALVRKPERKRKQDDAAVEVTEPGGEKPKPKRKPRAKKAASTAKKTTKASQRTNQKTANDVLPEDINLEDQRPKTRPRGKRKKQEDIVAEDAQPKPKRTKTTKTSTTVPQSPEVGREQDDKKNKTVRPELKVPSGKPFVDLALDDTTVQSQTKTKKRKATDLDVEDEPPPPKRKARSRSKAQSTKKVAEVAMKEKQIQNSLGVNTTSLALADAINFASGKLAADRDYDKLVSPVEMPRVKCVLRPKEGSDSQIERTSPQPQAEVGDDPPLPQCVGKKNRTGPGKAPKILLQPQPDCMPSTEKSGKPVSKSSKEANPIEEDGRDRRAPKTASRKRKENSTTKKPGVGVPIPKGGKRQRNRPRIPKHVKQKLETRHDNYASDDEPDPIDFLS